MEKQNIFAYVEVEGKTEIYRVKLNGEVQSELTNLLKSQEEEFFAGIEDEIQFDGVWKTDEHEVFYLENIQEVEKIKTAFIENSLSYDELDLKKFNQVKIKALLSGRKDGEEYVIQVQRFTASQMLSRGKIALLFWNNAFNKVSEPLFTIGNKLAAVSKGNRMYFKSWAVVRGIFDLLDLYEKATDDELGNFIRHENILCDDSEAFFKNANATVRKKITALSKNLILENLDVVHAEKVSENFLDFPLIKDNKVFLPSERKELNKVLDFLLDNLYEAPLSGEKYRTNSKQPLKAKA